MSDKQTTDAYEAAITAKAVDLYAKDAALNLFEAYRAFTASDPQVRYDYRRKATKELRQQS